MNCVCLGGGVSSAAAVATTGVEFTVGLRELAPVEVVGIGRLRDSVGSDVAQVPSQRR